MYFQLHGIRQQSSENKSAHKKSCYLSSPKNKKKIKKTKSQSKYKLWHSSVKTSKQKQTNRERCGYRFPSGSRDIFQLRSTHERVQSVYLIFKYSIFNIDTFFLQERKDSSNFYAHNLSLYNLSVIYLLDLSCSFKPMLLRNVLNSQQERKDCYFFLSYLSNRALYHPQAEELVSASDSCSSTIAFAAKPRFKIYKHFSRVQSKRVT